MMDERDVDFTVKGNEAVEAPRSKELERRCQEAGIQFDFRAIERGAGYLVKAKSGREEHSLRILPDDYSEVLQIPFERVRLLNEYIGIYDYDENHIEVAVSPVAPQFFGRLRRRVRTQEGQSKDEWLELVFGNPELEGLYCTLGKGSLEFRVLVRSSYRYRIHTREVVRRPTLQIDGVPISQYDDMLEKLRLISDTCLFRVASQFDIAFELMDHSEKRAWARRSRRQALRESVQIPFPKSRYDSEPLRFHRYALSAVRLPLLQYLAFYQVLEYYFPRYSGLEARLTARKVLNMAGFSSHDDEHVDRLVAVIKAHRDEFGGEDSQLAATLRACLWVQPLVEWIRDDKERERFFTKGSESRIITPSTLQLDDEDSFTTTLANRIYSIRSRIVHSKEEFRGRPKDMILPYSEAAKRLYDDIELIRQVAEQVIAKSAQPLQMGG